LQIACYTLAVAGYLWQRKGKTPHILGIPFSFCLVNLAALIGVARFGKGVSGKLGIVAGNRREGADRKEQRICGKEGID